MSQREWQSRSLGELVTAAGGLIKTGPFGSQLHASEYTDDPDGVPVVMPKDMINGRIDRASVSRVSDAVAERLSVHRLAAGDLVLARRGDVGRLAFVETDEAGWLCGTGSMRIHAPDRDVLDARFLRYAMSAPAVAEWLVGQAVGATMPNLNATIVAGLPITAPGVRTQRRLAALLSAFDELMEINERRVELLESLARSLYREWIVHFRYPGNGNVKYHDSELGPIPDRWGVHGLFDVADVAFGFPFKSSRFMEADRPFRVIRIRDLPRGTSDTFTDEEPDARYRVIDGDILVGMDGNFYVRQWSGGESWLNQRVARLRPRGDLGSRHLMLLVEGPIRTWNRSIVGTTVAHLGKRHLEEIRVAVPPHDLLKTAGAALDSFADFQRTCETWNRQLAATRDMLLSRLVTGRLDISDIDLGVLTPTDPE